MLSKQPTKPELTTWEQAEIERSAHEAAHIDDASLRMGNVQRYFDPPPSTPYPLEYVFHLLGDIRGKTVLDFGCGTGENTVLLTLRGARVIALDISPEFIELTRRRLKINNVSSENVQFVVGSAHSTELPDESVDAVLGIAILHHVDLEIASRELWRVLRKGGLAVFQEPVRDSSFIRAVRKVIV